MEIGALSRGGVAGFKRGFSPLQEEIGGRAGLLAPQRAHLAGQLLRVLLVTGGGQAFKPALQARLRILILRPRRVALRRRRTGQIDHRRLRGGQKKGGENAHGREDKADMAPGKRGVSREGARPGR